MQATRLLVNPVHPESDRLDLAAETLSSGGMVVFPTETVYGLAGDTQIPDVERCLYAAKGRAEDKPFTYFCPDLAGVEAFGVVLNPVINALAKAYWPGPLTMVLRTGKTFTGFRIPDHAVPLGILARTCRAFAVTSANRSGSPDAVSAEQAEDDLGTQVQLILDGGRCGQGIPSTVIKIDGNLVEVLRAGAIGETEIRAIAAGVCENGYE